MGEIFAVLFPIFGISLFQFLAFFQWIFILFFIELEKSFLSIKRMRTHIFRSFSRRHGAFCRFLIVFDDKFLMQLFSDIFVVGNWFLHPFSAFLQCKGWCFLSARCFCMPFLLDIFMIHVFKQIRFLPKMRSRFSGPGLFTGHRRIFDQGKIGFWWCRFLPNFSGGQKFLALHFCPLISF